VKQKKYLAVRRARALSIQPNFPKMLREMVREFPGKTFHKIRKLLNFPKSRPCNQKPRKFWEENQTSFQKLGYPSRGPYFQEIPESAIRSDGGPERISLRQKRLRRRTENISHAQTKEATFKGEKIVLKDLDSPMLLMESLSD